jgi:glycosyltransferase involved in cell wall biosynthesis
MEILVLCEGDAETRDSWSGISKSTVETLRDRGHQVRCGDVDLYGWPRALAATRSLSLDRRRWGVRYHLGRDGFIRRSRMAARRIMENPGVDVILQIGATFEPAGRGAVPYVVYADSNIRFAARAAFSGHTDAVSLDSSELAEVARREELVYSGAAAVLTLSERLRRSFVEDFRLPPQRVYTVHGGPNLPSGPLPTLRSGRRPEAPPTILFVGRQFERKGGDLLLSAFEIVRGRMPDARLVIVGPTGISNAGPGVEVLGFLDKDSPQGWSALAAAYASVDVFCLPTRFEPFGIAFLEAMAFGLPCVGPASWAVPEMVAHGETGLTFPPGDERALADCLTQLLQNPDLAFRMGRAGRSRVDRYFNWTAAGERIENALRHAIADNGAASRQVVTANGGTDAAGN